MKPKFPTKSTKSPLAGLRILDLSRILAGPTCTQLLGDLGADVIKIEKPGNGDDTRAWGPPFVTGEDNKQTSESAYYLSSNRNKRSIAIDITKPEGSWLIRELLKKCDVLIENFKVGGLAKYQLGYADLEHEFPQLIYCSITGFGQTGPNAAMPGYDLMAQAYGGIMSLTGEPQGEPMKVGVAVADVMCGMYASTAILAALRHRDQFSEGQHIDISLVDSQIAWLINQGCNYLVSGELPKRYGNQHPNIVPYQVFAASDGHLIVAVGNDNQFSRFCEIIGKVELANDQRYITNEQRLKHREELIPILADCIIQMKKDRLLELMLEAGIPGGPINNLQEVFDSEQVEAREMRIQMHHPLAQNKNVELIGNPIKFSKTPVSYRQTPPTCGQHSDEIMQELLDEAALLQAQSLKLF